MPYRARATPLHAAGPGAALIWCLALLLAVLVHADVPALGAVSLIIVAASLAAGLRAEWARSLRWSLAMGLLICLINALVSEQGTSVLWHFGDLPLLGERYVTAQGVATGAIDGLIAVDLISLGLLYSLAVDPDAVLALSRRLGFRSALTASVATRMVPVLLRDSRRLAEAQRTRPGPVPSRVALLAASTGGALDRALDVAATLEVRGFGLAVGRGAGPSRPRNRHDLGFLASAAGLVAFALLARLATPWCALGLAPAALAPFLDRRGVGVMRMAMPALDARGAP